MESRRVIKDPSDSNMTVAEVLALGPEDLAQTQHDVLYSAALSILEDFVDKFRQKDYAAAREMLQFSRAGDGYGDDNYYLDMSCLGQNTPDMGEVIQRLEHLQLILNAGKAGNKK